MFLLHKPTIQTIFLTQETEIQALPFGKWFLNSVKLLYRFIKGRLVSPTYGNIAESHVTLMTADAIYFVGYEWKIVVLRFFYLNLPSKQCVRQESPSDLSM